MAITPPTPPTPPTAPVVPGARSSASDGGSTNAVQQGSSSTAGGDRGIHINISPPARAGSQQESNNTGAGENAAHQAAPKQEAGKQDKSQATQAGSSDDAAAKTAQQARQDMVQQALDTDEAAARQDVQQENSQQPWPLPGNQLGIMSYMPFLIVFIAAFVTFMLKNLSKKPAATRQKNNFPRRGSGNVGPIENRLPGKIDAVAGDAGKASSVDGKKKGSHFEMRI